MHKCAVAVISVSVLLVVILFFACCVCWKPGNDPLKQIYVLSKSGLKKSENSSSISGKFNPGRDFFKRFSASAGGLSVLQVRRSPSQHYFSTNRSNSENELLDSMNASNDFAGIVLQIETANLKQLKREEDDLSYLSDDSKNTFYSFTYPLTPAPSLAETMKSCLSEIDLNTL